MLFCRRCRSQFSRGGSPKRGRNAGVRHPTASPSVRRILHPSTRSSTNSRMSPASNLAEAFRVKVRSHLVSVLFLFLLRFRQLRLQWRVAATCPQAKIIFGPVAHEMQGQDWCLSPPNLLTSAILQRAPSLGLSRLPLSAKLSHGVAAVGLQSQSCKFSLPDTNPCLRVTMLLVFKPKIEKKNKLF